MQLKIVQLDVKITEEQVRYLNETLRMQLGRYAQIIELVSIIFSQGVDKFGQSVINCEADAELVSSNKISASNTSTRIDDSFYNAISRMKRQLGRQRRSNKRQINPVYFTNK
ncbi:MAG: ribosome-associated translation inhibitor RaiA [Glaciecola sp.]|jgi:ribosome-associated translation inhibitor RaiA